jgi:hypothetical protein
MFDWDFSGGDTALRFPLAPSFRRFAPVIWGLTLSSGNVRQAHCLRNARVTFPQRLLKRI